LTLWLAGLVNHASIGVYEESRENAGPGTFFHNKWLEKLSSNCSIENQS